MQKAIYDHNTKITTKICHERNFVSLAAHVEVLRDKRMHYCILHIFFYYQAVPQNSFPHYAGLLGYSQAGLIANRDYNFHA